MDDNYVAGKNIKSKEITKNSIIKDPYRWKNVGMFTTVRNKRKACIKKWRFKDSYTMSYTGKGQHIENNKRRKNKRMSCQNILQGNMFGHIHSKQVFCFVFNFLPLLRKDECLSYVLGLYIFQVPWTMPVFHSYSSDTALPKMRQFCLLFFSP